MSLFKAVAMIASSFMAGAINSVAGGGTLLTFPVLISLGLDPKVANATSTVALWPGLLGGAWGYRSEIKKIRELLIPFGVVSIFGGLFGAILLILTPPTTFAHLVPFLILFATILFAVQEPVSKWLRSRKRTEEPAQWKRGAMVAQFFSATYGGYFGAGNGIVMLAILGLLGLNDIHQANGLKNFLGLSLNIAAIVSFIIAGIVFWPDAAVMAVAAIIGGYGGAQIAQRLGRVFVRRTVIVIGFSMAILMLWKLYDGG